MRLALPTALALWLVSMFSSGWLSLTKVAHAAGDVNLSDAQDAEERYKVPDGTPAQLLEFIANLEKYRPKDLRDARDHRSKAPKALQEAAAKILEKEKDKTSEAYKKAEKLVMLGKLNGIHGLSPEEQRKVWDAYRSMLAEKSPLTPQDMGQAGQVAYMIGAVGNHELSAEAYKSLAEIFGKSQADHAADFAKQCAGAAHRLSLFHKFFDVKGTTLDDKEFDWSKYRGKVVLIDFWATWCGPCLAELPNVKKNYERYHDKGFDVVGISIDDDREKLEEFLEKDKLPWTILNEDRAGWKSAIAEEYGISGIPTVILVDKEGKVLSFNARGPALGKLLAEQLGPVPGGDDDKDQDKDDDDK
jgi:thiol-disulfide isomerase/thioredoxin